jgi:hypothetical protein
LPTIAQQYEAEYRFFRDRYFAGEYAITTRNIADCWRRKSESLLLDSDWSGELQLHGRQLAGAGLYQVPISRLTDVQPKLFVNPLPEDAHNFRPDKHVVAIGIDLNSPTSAYQSINPAMIGVMANVMNRLNIRRFFATGFYDRLVSTDSHGDVLLHITTPLHDGATEVVETFWRKLFAVVRQGPRLPGSPMAWQPLQFRTAIQDVADSYFDSREEFFTWILLSPYWLAPSEQRSNAIEDLNDRIELIQSIQDNPDWGFQFSKASSFPKELTGLTPPGSWLSRLKL